MNRVVGRTVFVIVIWLWSLYYFLEVACGDISFAFQMFGLLPPLFVLWHG